MKAGTIATSGQSSSSKSTRLNTDNITKTWTNAVRNGISPALPARSGETPMFLSDVGRVIVQQDLGVHPEEADEQHGHDGAEHGAIQQRVANDRPQWRRIYRTVPRSGRAAYSLSSSAVSTIRTTTITQPSAKPPRSSANARHPRPAAARRRCSR